MLAQEYEHKWRSCAYIHVIYMYKVQLHCFQSINNICYKVKLTQLCLKKIREFLEEDVRRKKEFLTEKFYKDVRT